MIENLKNDDPVSQLKFFKQSRKYLAFQKIFDSFWNYFSEEFQRWSGQKVFFLEMSISVFHIIEIIFAVCHFSVWFIYFKNISKNFEFSFTLKIH